MPSYLEVPSEKAAFLSDTLFLWFGLKEITTYVFFSAVFGMLLPGQTTVLELEEISTERENLCQSLLHSKY